jgi:alpha/beta superfamily hydrolase
MNQSTNNNNKQQQQPRQLILPSTSTTPPLQIFIDYPTITTTMSSPWIAVFTHPHPKLGGDANNNVVMALSRALTSKFNVTAIRFNTRGVGESGGWSTWRGVSERDDIKQVLLFARERANELGNGTKILLCAYSFGAAVGLSTLSMNPTLADAVAIFGYPKGWLASVLFSAHYSHVDVKGGIPKLYVLGNQDDFTSVDTMKSLVEQVSEPKELRIVQGEHFFFEREGILAKELIDWFSKL